jgi:hypothetical protein
MIPFALSFFTTLKISANWRIDASSTITPVTTSAMTTMVEVGLLASKRKTNLERQYMNRIL